jgi:hypothetical protein
MRLRTPQIQVPIEEIIAFCSRNHIRSLALFGSILIDDFGQDSDIDVLVEFEPGHIPGFQFFAMQDELSAIFGQKVDLNTDGFLSPHFHAEVRENALVYYVKP